MRWVGLYLCGDEYEQAELVEILHAICDMRYAMHMGFVDSHPSSEQIGGVPQNI